MKQEICSEAQFLQDVKDHHMKVFKDEGVYRHIQFMYPGTYNRHFNLVTWPGYLAYSGDMGCYVFSRLQDMFEFFRADKKGWVFNREGGLSINPGYWSGKLQSGGGSRSAKEFDHDRFEEVLRSQLREFFREKKLYTTKNQRRMLWEEFTHSVLPALDGGEHQAYSAASDFHLALNDSVHFEFQDFWDYDFSRFTYQFLWCCYALSWGIEMYDAKKKGPEE